MAATNWLTHLKNRPSRRARRDGKARVEFVLVILAALMVGFAISNFGKAALDILYPARCVTCNRLGDFLCGDCYEKLPRAGGLRCPVCWLPVWGPNCDACAANPPSFTALRSSFRYADDVHKLVHAFKYGGQSSLAPSLAAPMLESVLAGGLEADVILPVPMTGLRQRQRGYNQAALLAKELGKALDLPLSDGLRRRHTGVQQAKSRSAVDRWRNVQGAFDIPKSGAIAGRRALLVDDVATTGATLDACSRVLLDAGAIDVVAVTLARED